LVIYCEAFCSHDVSSFSCILVVYPELVLFLIPFAICVFVLWSVQVEVYGCFNGTYCSYKQQGRSRKQACPLL